MQVLTHGHVHTCTYTHTQAHTQYIHTHSNPLLSHKYIPQGTAADAHRALVHRQWGEEGAGEWWGMVWGSDQVLCGALIDHTLTWPLGGGREIWESLSQCAGSYLKVGYVIVTSYTHQYCSSLFISKEIRAGYFSITWHNISILILNCTVQTWHGNIQIRAHANISTGEARQQGFILPTRDLLGYPPMENYVGTTFIIINNYEFEIALITHLFFLPSRQW